MAWRAVVSRCVRLHSCRIPSGNHARGEESDSASVPEDRFLPQAKGLSARVHAYEAAARKWEGELSGLISERDLRQAPRAADMSWLGFLLSGKRYILVCTAMWRAIRHWPWAILLQEEE